MYVLLINPAKLLQKSTERFSQRIKRWGIHGGDSPPLGICYVASACERKGYNVKILDMRIETQTKERFKDYIKDFNPEVIGLYLTTFNIPEAVDVGQAVKRINHKINIIVGGPNLSLYPQYTLKHLCFDYGLMGEADYSFVELLDKLPENKKDIPGLVYRENGQIKTVGCVQVIKDLDSLPFPSRHLLSPNYHYFATFSEPFTSIVTSRGCPFDCSFCGKLPEQQTLRLRSSEGVIKEFQQIQIQGFKEVAIYDDIFSIDRERTLKICQGLIDNEIKINWSARLRIDLIDAEILSKMKEAGCRRVYFGIESGSDGILRKMDKRISKHQAIRVLRQAKDIGLEVISYFILGFPGEDELSLQETVRVSKDTSSDFCSFNIFQPLPNSPVFKEILNNGFKDEWPDYILLTKKLMPVYHGDLSRKLVEGYFKKAIREFYLRPVVIFNILKMIKNKTRLKNFCLAFVSIIFLILRKEVIEKS